MTQRTDDANTQALVQIQAHRAQQARADWARAEQHVAQARDALAQTTEQLSAAQATLARLHQTAEARPRSVHDLHDAYLDEQAQRERVRRAQETRDAQDAKLRAARAQATSLRKAYDAARERLRVAREAQDAATRARAHARAQAHQDELDARFARLHSIDADDSHDEDIDL